MGKRDRKALPLPILSRMVCPLSLGSRLPARDAPRRRCRADVAGGGGGTSKNDSIVSVLQGSHLLLIGGLIGGLKIQRKFHFSPVNSIL